MILTGSKIAREVRAGRLTIDPFDPASLNPNSYNYHLGRQVRVCRQHVIDSRRQAVTEDIEIPDEGIVLRPGRCHLGTTAEAIGSECYVPSLIGRSSLGRLGVYLQVSADLGNLGAVHRWTLEIVVCQPIRLYAAMVVGQVSFWVPYGEKRTYDGYFGNFSVAVTPPPALLESR